MSARPKLAIVDPPSLYRIERGVPIPARGAGVRKPRPCPYPLLDMEPNTSFLVPCTRREIRKVAQSVGRWVRIVRREYPDVQFTTRKTTDGVRCWRTR